MHGESVSSLYSDRPIIHRDDDLAKAGKGLFVRGGNPMYYTTKGTESEIARNMHAVLKQSLEDLGGHHVIFKTSIDPETLEPFMHIDRVPLTAAPINAKGSKPDPALFVYDSVFESFSTHGEFGWRSNLQANMVRETEDIRPLYPISTSDGDANQNRKWSCPLRRMAFWTKVVSDFNPVVPSPIRASRLFGGDSVQV